MGGVAKNVNDNGIQEFQIWTDSILKIDLPTAKDLYLMGYADGEKNTEKKAKELNLAARSLEYSVYERGVFDGRYPAAWRIKKF